MIDENLYTDPNLTRFYDLENTWAPDFDFCRTLGEGRMAILDLGCGTGMFAAEMARDGRHFVVGVDPAAAMLDIAKKRQGGERVEWMEGDARTLDLDRKFDFIVLTGHVFQIFLTDDDRAAVLRTIAQHLSADGIFIFDSRNPARAEWKQWTPENSTQHLAHPELGDVLAWNDVSPIDDAGVITYHSFYKVMAEARTYSSSARIAFPSRDSIVRQIGQAGLAVDKLLGDWNGAPWTDHSKEIIALGRLG